MEAAMFSDTKKDQPRWHGYLGIALLKPLVWTLSSDYDWKEWLEIEHPRLDGKQSGLVLILARRSGEPEIEPVIRAESDDWIKSIRKATNNESSASALRGTGGGRKLRSLPFSERTFREIARRLYIHDSIIRTVSRADVSEFSAASLEMGELSANVYNMRTSNAWDQDLAVSVTHFPHCGLTFAIMFGCTLSVEAEVLTRLSAATYEIYHPLLVPSIIVEIERKRHLPIVEETLDELEARMWELDEDPVFMQGMEEAEKAARKEAKRSASLDMLYLRNQLISWKTCLEALYKHINLLDRTISREEDMQYQYRNECTGNGEGNISEFDSYSKDSSSDMSPADMLPNGHTRGTNISRVIYKVPQMYSHQKSKPESLIISKSHIIRTGAKIRGRLQEIIKDYNEKIRECTTGVEGMVMATQWAQGETNVEIALATSQDSRHMRSIALVTMIFLPGTFFASIFSMGFFEWQGMNGTIVVSQSFWIYVVLAAGFTAFTVGAWWYLGVYRYKRHRGMVSSLSQRGASSWRLLSSLMARRQQ
ncbi:hypothetical protein FGADI_5760 [Fusarium gaditjirri]|uniref:Uncharacterized protein n=1 Tax=Fusarium gaditjirri TaxID=282569 RepID=A0A8H4T9C5_9HYPO|nr:hypothetical protein FGADI_5760 [Fusarium gaditjirri]